jgi:hypothetical protein
MYAKSILLFIIALVNFVFAIIIFRRRHGRAYNIYYSMVVFFLAAWSLSLGMFYFEPPVHNIRFWINMVYLSGSLIPTFFLPFSLIFHANKRISRRELVLMVQPVLVIGYLLFFTDTIIESLIISGRIQVFGPFYGFFVAHFVVYMIFAFYNLFCTRRNSIGVARSQMNYVIYGTIFTAVLGGTTDIAMLAMGNFSLGHVGPYFTIIMVGSFLYAMRRHDFTWGFLARWNRKSGFV